MERFLTELYQEGMDKTAEAELEEALVAQPMEVLEALLGLDKEAVAGPVEPSLPTPRQGKVLDARQKAVDEFSAKNRVEAPPTREQAAAASHTNDEGEQKAAMVWADRMGRKLASALAHHQGERRGMKMQDKQSQGIGDSGGMGLAGGGADQGIETTGSMDGGAEMTTTASMKAKIAEIALRATRGAPPHIRKVAAVVAGQKIAAVGEQGTRPFRFGH